MARERDKAGEGMQRETEWDREGKRKGLCSKRNLYACLGLTAAA